MMRLIIRGMLVLLASVALTIFVPGLVAAHDRVFYDSDVRAKLPRGPSDLLAKHESLKTNIVFSINALTKDINDIKYVNQQNQLDFDLKLLQQRKQELSEVSPPFLQSDFS